jgi:hypothetical protein
MRQRGTRLAQAAAEDGRDPFEGETGLVYRAMASPLAPGGLRPYGLFVPRRTKALISRRPVPAERLPDWGWLIATPSGYGNTMYTGPGEEEILEVTRDVASRYAVDPDRIVLAGISRGGWAAVDIGMRHAGEFAAVVDNATCARGRCGRSSGACSP